MLAGHRKSWYVQSGVATCTGCDWTVSAPSAGTDEAHQKHWPPRSTRRRGLTRKVSKSRAGVLSLAELNTGMAHGHWVGGWTPGGVVMTFTAKYSSQCPACGERIHEGQQVRYGDDLKWCMTTAPT